MVWGNGGMGEVDRSLENKIGGVLWIFFGKGEEGWTGNGDLNQDNTVI